MTLYGRAIYKFSTDHTDTASATVRLVTSEHKNKQQSTIDNIYTSEQVEVRVVKRKEGV